MVEIKDIKPQWLNVIRRLQSALAQADNHGDAIISIVILVNELNVPTDWLEPEVRKIEPKANAVDRSPERRHLLTALGTGVRSN